MNRSKVYPCRLCGLNHSKIWSCQSWKDQLRSSEIYAGHKLGGEYCKEWQQCSTCTMIKHYFRVLRHFSGRCSGRKNNKCPVCLEHKQSVHNIEGIYRKQMPKIVKTLYVLVLKGKYRWNFIR